MGGGAKFPSSVSVIAYSRDVNKALRLIGWTLATSCSLPGEGTHRNLEAAKEGPCPRFSSSWWLAVNYHLREAEEANLWVGRSQASSESRWVAQAGGNYAENSARYFKFLLEAG